MHSLHSLHSLHTLIYALTALTLTALTTHTAHTHTLHSLHSLHSRTHAYMHALVAVRLCLLFYFKGVHVQDASAKKKLAALQVHIHT
jgi:fluoride ion exporter CrcB/FEX